jgi:hypothetical protein
MLPSKKATKIRVTANQRDRFILIMGRFENRRHRFSVTTGGGAKLGNEWLANRQSFSVADGLSNHPTVGHDSSTGMSEFAAERFFAAPRSGFLGIPSPALRVSVW